MAEVKLLIKKIPNKVTLEKLEEILDKSIKYEYHNLHYVKPSYKYDSKNNNICFITVKDMDTRLKLMRFLDDFEFINNRGQKHKLTIDTCIVQQLKEEDVTVDDTEIEGTYSDLLHFKKFKEMFEKDEIVKFKQDEGKYDGGILDGIKEATVVVSSSNTNTSVSSKSRSMKSKKEAKYYNKLKEDKKILMQNRNGKLKEVLVEYTDKPKENDLKEELKSRTEGVEVIGVTKVPAKGKGGYEENYYNHKHKDTTKYYDDKYETKKSKSGKYKEEKIIEKSYEKGSSYYDKGYEKGSYYDQEYNKTYDKGYDKGYTKEYDKGYDKAYDKGYDKSYDKTYDKGYDKTYDKGYDKSYDKGNDKKGSYAKGSYYDQGYDDNYDKKGYGKDSYYDKGYDKGSYYEQGYEKGSYYDETKYGGKGGKSSSYYDSTNNKGGYKGKKGYY